MTKDTFNEREMLAAIERDIAEQVASKRHHLCFCPSEAQAFYIQNARAAGISWDDIMAYCKSRGWPGAESTMLKWLRDQGRK